MASELCARNCMRKFVENLEDRQDIRESLGKTPDAARFSIQKTKFREFLENGVAYDEIFVGVVHQLLHVYCYADTTVLYYQALGLAHFMNHDFPGKTEILEKFKNGAKKFKCASCALTPAEIGLFDVIFEFKGKEESEFKKSNSEIENFNMEPALKVVVTELTDCLTFDLVYSGNGQEGSQGHVTLSQLAVTAQLILDQILNFQELPLEKLKFTPDTINFPETTQNPKSEFKNMSELFDSTVRRIPNKIGLVAGDRKFTYAQIHQRANQIADHIRSKVQFRSDALIALCLDRTELIIFGILGIWKVGGAYVPIDPNYPPNRIQLILDDCQPIALLTDKASSSKLPQMVCPVIDISSFDLQVCNPMQVSKSEVNDLALVVYTSGTTGTPKGVMLRQSAVVNQCLDYPLRYPDLSRDEVVVQLFNYAFAAFLEPLTLSISQGLTLVMVPFDLLMQPKALLDYFELNQVTHIDGTPSLVAQFDLHRLRKLKRIAVGGEPLTSAQHSTFLKHNPSIKIYNVYGNSEGTMCSLTADVTSGRSFSFDRTVANKKVLLLSNDLKPVPPGAIGEICLSGAGLARGYLKNENLTKQKFLKNPFLKNPGNTLTEPGNSFNVPEIWGRLYRTGDFGVEVDGKIQILGRKDLQVKVRGIRIEVLEVETTMLKVPEISRAVVISKTLKEGNQLLGFFVPKSNVASTHLERENLTKKVRQFLKLNIPEYMIPTTLICLSKFPLTPNGKIDRTQLQEISPPNSNISKKSAPNLNQTPQNLENPPKSSEELVVAQIWEDVLCLPPNSVDLTSNFFSLGGNSLLAIKVINLLFQKLDLEVNPAKVMESGGSFESFLTSTEIQTTSDKNYDKIPKRPNLKEAPLSTSQERILVSRQRHHHNVVFEFEISGGENLEPFLVRISALVEKHVILRTVYPKSRFGTKIQKILESVEMPVQLFKNCTEAVQDFVQTEFDLSVQIPLRVGLFKTESGKIQKILVVSHSIAMDYSAQSIFVQELLRLHEDFNTEIINYADFAFYQKNFHKDDEINDLLTFWKQSFNLPPKISTNSGPITSEEFFTSWITLTADELESLRSFASRFGVSLYDLFLSGQVMTEKVIDPDEEVTVGTFLSLRDHPQLYELLGNLTQVIPLTFDLGRDGSIEKVIRKVAADVKKSKANLLFPIDMGVASAGGVHRLVEHDSVQFLFDFVVDSAPRREEFEVGGAKYILRSIHGGWPILPATKVLTTVRIEDGIARVEFRGRQDIELFQQHFRDNLDRIIRLK